MPHPFSVLPHCVNVHQDLDIATSCTCRFLSASSLPTPIYSWGLWCNGLDPELADHQDKLIFATQWLVRQLFYNPHEYIRTRGKLLQSCPTSSSEDPKVRYAGPVIRITTQHTMTTHISIYLCKTHTSLSLLRLTTQTLERYENTYLKN